MSPLLADFIHARACKPFCEKSLTLPFLGVVNDPTTAGVADSTQALTYLEPKKSE